MNKPEKYAVIGYPLGYSLSPLLHNKFFIEENIPAKYISLPVKKEELKNLVDSKEYTGFNVTVPHKENIIPYLHELTDIARRIGAVNTVKKLGDFYMGTNTDAGGFLLMLEQENKPEMNNKNIIILGAGGASKAISYSALESNAQNIYIYDLDAAKTQALLDNYKTKKLKALQTKKQLIEVLASADFVINATPVGMESTINESVLCLDDLQLLKKRTLVIDIIYAPLKTKLLQMAESLGLQTLNGLGMLAGQAILAERFWFNKSIAYLQAKQILQDGL
ncbi:MAG: shikimate dehydrogenase [Candidatus Margulisbacteria bacterium]|nr:shikimate dehydrogenase [Candidatus Margulisiibacteriota bacterium]